MFRFFSDFSPELERGWNRLEQLEHPLCSEKKTRSNLVPTCSNLVPTSSPLHTSLNPAVRASPRCSSRVGPSAVDPRPVRATRLAMRVAAARVGGRRAGGDGMGACGGVRPDRDVRTDSEIQEFSFQTPDSKSPPKEAALRRGCQNRGSKTEFLNPRYHPYMAGGACEERIQEFSFQTPDSKSPPKEAALRRGCQNRGQKTES